MRYASKTDVGRRSGNEDACYAPSATSDIPFVIVSDGMGGHAAGEVASRMVVNGMLEEMASLRADELSRQLSSAVMTVNLDVFRAARDDTSLSGMGATLVCAVLFPDRYLCANVGDSRLYHFSKNTLVQITHDHSYVQMLVDCGDITLEEARLHPRRNLITRAMGVDSHVMPELFATEWKKGDVLLLCSDGLCGPLQDAQIAEILQRDRTLEEKCALLIQAALDNDGTDNITVVLVENDGGIQE